MLAGWRPLPMKSWLQVIYPLLKAAIFDTFCLVAPQTQEGSEEAQQHVVFLHSVYKARLKARYKQFPSPTTISGTWIGLSSKAGFISRSTAVAVMSLCPGMRPGSLWWAGGSHGVGVQHQLFLTYDLGCVLLATAGDGWLELIYLETTAIGRKTAQCRQNMFLDTN